jgi:hypothetical protein
MLQGNFFSRLRSLFSNADPAKIENRNGVANSDAPRHRHYYFAYEYLPEKAGNNAKDLVDKLRGDSATDYLNFLWESSCSEVNAVEEEFIPTDDLACFPVEIDAEHYGVIVRFPRPKRTLEAYFAAIIVPAKSENTNDYRYFTLELGEDLDGSKRTVLCELSEDRHINYGDGSKPEQEAFAKSLSTFFSNQNQG